MEYKSLKIKITIGVLLVFIGIIIISWNYLLEKKNQVYDTMYYEIASLPSYIEDQEKYEKEKVEEQIKDIINTKPNNTIEHTICKIDIILKTIPFFLFLTFSFLSILSLFLSFFLIETPLK